MMYLLQVGPMRNQLVKGFDMPHNKRGERVNTHKKKVPIKKKKMPTKKKAIKSLS